jgi:hypothetical protein
MEARLPSRRLGNLVTVADDLLDVLGRRVMEGDEAE